LIWKLEHVGILNYVKRNNWINFYWNGIILRIILKLKILNKKSKNNINNSSNCNYNYNNKLNKLNNNKNKLNNY
jgi:hypothetical protein